MNLRKALRLRKARYLKRTGSPGHYKYEYREGKRPKIATEMRKLKETTRTKKESEKGSLRQIRDLGPGQKVEIKGKTGTWKYKGNKGGDYEFERTSKIGPLNDSRNYLILRNGGQNVRLLD